MPCLFRARRDQRGGRRRRWLATTAATVLAGATMFAFSATPATAAPSPRYHAGTDTATFSVLGVTDANCFLGTGGNEIWIKRGDRITFNSSLVGLKLGDLRLNRLLTNLLGGLLGPLLGAKVTDFDITGLRVSATIDKGKSSEQRFTVTSAGTYTVRDLDAGAHSLDWTVDSITVLPVLKKLLGGTVEGDLTTISLDKALSLGATLKTGASLNWHGTIHVTENANNCTLPSVSVPGVEVTVGKTKVTTPQLNVDPNPGSSSGPISVDTPTGSTPTTGTQTPGTSHDQGTGPGSGTQTDPGTQPGSGTHTDPGNGGASRGTASTGAGPNGNRPASGTTSSGGFGNAYPNTGGAGSGGFGNAYPDTGGGLLLGNGANGANGAGHGAQNGSVPAGGASSQHLAAAEQDQQDATSTLADSKPITAQMPVLLAIAAIIALALVTATYARLYLLRRT